MARRPVGRPTKLTPKVVDALCENIEVGAGYADAAHAAGIANSTLSYWRNAGEEINERVQAEGDQGAGLSQDELRLWDFWKRFRAAEAQGAVNCATMVYNAAMKDPDKALQWLERRRPEEWGYRQAIKQELTGVGGGPVVIRWPDEPGE